MGRTERPFTITKRVGQGPEMNSGITEWRKALSEHMQSRGACREGDRTLVQNFAAPRQSNVRGSWLVGRQKVESVPNCTIRDTELVTTHFRGCDLRNLRVSRTRVEDCVFEDCDLTDLRCWNSEWNNVEFRNCRMSVILGSRRSPPAEGNPVRFRGVRMVGGRWTDGVAGDTVFENCAWEKCPIRKYAFQSCTFTYCSFHSDLRDVEFAIQYPNGAPSVLNVCDFAKARFCEVEFRQTTLPKVIWPENDDTIVIRRNFGGALDTLIAELSKMPEQDARALAAGYGSHRKWLHPEQDSGVISLLEVRDFAGEKGERWVRQICSRFTAP